MKQITISARAKPKPQPWVSDQLRRLLERRKHLHARVLKHPGNESVKQQYRATRREGTLLNRKLRREYYNREFRDVKNKPRQQWALLNSLTGRNFVREQPKATLGDLSATFASIVTDPNPCPPLSNLIPDISTTADADAPSFKEFRAVSALEISDLLKHLNCAKAAGSDDIPPLLLRLCEPAAAGPIAQIINESLSTGMVPDVYKLATVCPVHKSGDKSEASNYRPVSLLPIVSKILEKVVHRQMIRFLQDHAELRILPDEQFAYRRGHSCEDALTLAVNRWMMSVDKGEYCGVVLVDMSKAFDRVRHELLLNELQAIGISGVALQWFSSYLQGRRQQVKIGNNRGDETHCTRGVPQGSVLGPLLFSLYVRHVPGVLRHAESQQYADDIAFYIHCQSTGELQHKLTSELNRLNTYLGSIGLILNAQKTKFMVLRKKALPLPPDLTIACGGVDIRPSATARYLGLIIDQHLTFEDQVNHVCTSVYKKIGAFRRCRRTVDHTTKRIFYLSLIQSTIEYASNSYAHCLTPSLYSRLVTLSHISMKQVFGLPRRTPTVFVLRHAKLYSLESRLNLRLFIFVFRCIHQLTSPLLSSMFTLQSAATCTERRTRGQSFSSLSLPAATTRYGMFSISFLGADRWNSLPVSCRQVEHLSVFVSLCKEHLGFPVTRRQRL